MSLPPNHSRSRYRSVNGNSYYYLFNVKLYGYNDNNIVGRDHRKKVADRRDTLMFSVVRQMTHIQTYKQHN